MNFEMRRKEKGDMHWLSAVQGARLYVCGPIMVEDMCGSFPGGGRWVCVHRGRL